jgi:hypothetical protein
LRDRDFLNLNTGNTGNLSEAVKKYDEVLRKIEAVEISQQAKPLAWRLLWIGIGYLEVFYENFHHF